MQGLVLVRNAEYVGEDEPLRFGGKDMGLTIRGKQDAQELCKVLDRRRAVRIYSSDYTRAIETVSPLAETIGVEVGLEVGFRPFNVGECFGLTYAEVIQKLGTETWGEITTHPDPSKNYFKGGETLNDLAKRVWTRLNILSEMHGDENIIISTHMTPISAVLCKLLGVPLSKIWFWGQDLKSKHPSITRLDCREGKWSLRYYGLSIGDTDA